VEAARESIAAATEAGDAKGRAHALITMAGVGPARGVGDTAEALEMIAQARAAAEQADYRPQLQVAITESHVLEGIGEHEQAAAVARQAMALARARGLTRTNGSLLANNLAEPLVSLGRWDEAAEVTEHALELAPPPTVRSALLAVAAEVVLCRGQVAAAQDYVALAEPLMLGFLHEAQFALPVARMQAEVRLAQARPADALQAVAAVLERFDLRLILRYGWPLLATGVRACAQAALAAVAGRDQDLSARAAALRTTLGVLAEKMDAIGPVQEAWRLTVSAESAPADQAVSAWDDAVAAWDRVDQPYQRAAALLRAAEAALAAGDREAGEVRLLAAAQLADRLGARPLSEEIRLLARRARIVLATGAARPAAMGARRTGQPGADTGTRGSSGAAPDAASDRLGLTDREFEVLRLVAAGQSNREIAAQLFISAKTASVHVSNILAKLGVSSRVEAAATAYRLHLFDALQASS
jgi:DNA-binding CsgD family transcriptional regulator